MVRLQEVVVRAAEAWAVREWAVRRFPMEVREGQEIQVRQGETSRIPGRQVRGLSLFPACRLVLRDGGGMKRDLSRA